MKEVASSENDGLWDRLCQGYKCCTIDDDDEGIKLLADLSLCTYFGCDNRSVKEREVPRVVSITSEDDCHDSISDICEERHCSVKNAVLSPQTPRSARSDPDSMDAEDRSGSSTRRLDAPSQNEMNVIRLMHSLPPPSEHPCTGIDDQEELLEEGSDNDKENAHPPIVVLASRRNRMRRNSTSSVQSRLIAEPGKHVLSIDYEDTTPKAGHKRPEAPQEYPLVIYSNNNLSMHGPCTYVF